MDDEDRKVLMYRIAGGPYRKAGEEIGEVVAVLIDGKRFNVRLHCLDGTKLWVAWEETALVPDEDILAQFL